MIFEKKRKKVFLRYFLFFYVYSVFEWWVKEAPFFGRIWWNKNFTARASFFEPYCICGQNMSKNEPVAYSPKLALKISRRIFLWIFFAPILEMVWFSFFFWPKYHFLVANYHLRACSSILWLFTVLSECFLWKKSVNITYLDW